MENCSIVPPRVSRIGKFGNSAEIPPIAVRTCFRAADDPARLKKAASKTKYVCPECGHNAWAKLDAQLICGECYEDGEGEMCAIEAES